MSSVPSTSGLCRPWQTLESSSSSDSDDEEIFEFLNHIVRPRRPRSYKTRIDHFEVWDDGEFHNRFRLSKYAVMILLNKLYEHLLQPTIRNHAMEPVEMLLLTLRFLATNNFLISTGDFLGIHKTTASKHIWSVLKAIVKLKQEFIVMPTQSNMNEIKKGFYQIAKFPNVIGALDCTHVKIESPGGPEAELYRNRKNFFSINVQAICDSKLKFMNVVARWPGSAHDSRIFRNSKVKEDFENNRFGDGLLLGDSGYAVTKYCLTPLSSPATEVEELYNESQIRTRNPVERAFGVVKRRFPVLALGIRLSLVKVQYICVAAAILHNFSIDMKEDTLPTNSSDIEEAILNTDDVPVDPYIQNCNIDAYIKPYLNYFSNLLQNN